MSKKALYYLIALVIILAIAIPLYASRNKAVAPAETRQPLVNDAINVPAVTNTSQANADNPQPPTQLPTAANSNQTHFSDESDIGGTAVATAEVVYDGSKFSPASVTIKAGGTVVFKNNSTKSFRPASNPHPAHTDYPGFDALQALAPGQAYQFTFSKIGTWGYHNHLTPTVGGMVNVVP